MVLEKQKKPVFKERKREEDAQSKMVRSDRVQLGVIMAVLIVTLAI